jgi:hypothetical protein
MVGGLFNALLRARLIYWRRFLARISHFDPTATSAVHCDKLIPASDAFTVNSFGRVGFFTGAAPGIGNKNAVLKLGPPS